MVSGSRTQPAFFSNTLPPPRPMLPALSKPSVSRNICLQTRAPREQSQEPNEPLKRAPSSILGVLVDSVWHRQWLSWTASRLSVFPSVFTSGVPCLLHLFVKTVSGRDRRGSWMPAWASWTSGKQSPGSELLANTKTDPNMSSLQCHLEQKLIEGLLTGGIDESRDNCVALGHFSRMINN